jgi:general secretion pathway protein I
MILQRSEVRGQRSEDRVQAANRPFGLCLPTSVLFPLTSEQGESTAGRPRRRGLSLIEVLLALTIFMLALVVIGRLVDMGTDREMEARYQTRGTRLALDKLAEFESGARSLDETSGGFDGPDDGGWSWVASAQLQDQVAPNLYLVTVTVSRDLKGRDVSVTMSQMMLDPALTGSAAEAARPDPSTTPGGSP